MTPAAIPAARALHEQDSLRREKRIACAAAPTWPYPHRTVAEIDASKAAWAARFSLSGGVVALFHKDASA